MKVKFLYKHWRKEEKKYGNVISIILMQFESLDNRVDPLMHILIGLTNDNLNQMGMSGY